MGANKTGDWARVRHLINSMGPKMKEAQSEVLHAWAMKAEKIAVTHLSLQDLGWKPLKASTLAAKIRRGGSNQILIDTSDYFQSITSFVSKDRAMAGVKKDSTNSDGSKIWKIAKIQELGSESRNIPKRELWSPTFKEVMKWTVKHNNPVDIFLKKVR